MQTSTPVLATVVAAVVGFLIGSVNPATILARALGYNLESSGSGNPGATNAGRVMGRQWGVLVLVLDVLKAYLPTVLVAHFVGQVPALAVGMAVVLGHIYSPFLGGKGGKGVASTFGALLAVAPWVALGAVVVFGVSLAVARYVGSASVVTALVLGLVGAVAALGRIDVVDRPTGVWLVLMGAIVLLRHQRNIRAWWIRVRSRRS